MSFLFGSSGSDPQPFRGPGWQNQGEILNQFAIGQLFGANPYLSQGFQTNIDDLTRKMQEAQSQLANNGSQSYNSGLRGDNYQYQGQSPLNNALQSQIQNYQNQINQYQGYLNQVNAFKDAPNTSFTPGQAINGQMTSNVGNLPALSFQAPTAYQFSNPAQGFNFNLTPFNAQQAVGDAFTPLATNIQNIFDRRGQEQDLAIKEDLNSRGLLTSGATTKALADRREATDFNLSNALNQLAGQQAGQQLGAAQFQTQSQLGQQQAQLGSSQFNQQMDFNRQLNQAAELFRQQGASDQQAIAMAQDALGRAQLGFNQNLQGRQQGLQEFGVGNQLQRQPIDDLLRLYAFSTGANPGTPAQPGLLQSLAGGVGQGLGQSLPFMFCLPEGTEIETEHGSKPVEKIRPGESVKGGTVIATSSRLRRDGHKFYRHEFSDGKSIVMSNGHPYFGDLTALMVEEHESKHTYDILTDSGYYFSNGVKLGSTISG